MIACVHVCVRAWICTFVCAGLQQKRKSILEALTQSPEIFSFAFQVSVRIDRIDTKQMEQMHFWLTGFVYRKNQSHHADCMLSRFNDTVYWICNLCFLSLPSLTYVGQLDSRKHIFSFYRYSLDCMCPGRISLRIVQLP